MPRREQQEEHEANSERWMLTYLDMITLLMIFFVVMYSMSNVNKQKFAALASQLSIAMGSSSILPGQSSATGIDTNSQITPRQTEVPGGTNGQTEIGLEQVEKEIRALINQEHLGQYVTENLDERGVVISMREALLFEKGSADINQNANEVLGGIAKIISNTNNFIRVEGFTDDLPIHTQKYASNWELASQRAVNVVKRLIGAGLDPSRASAMSYGEYRPVVPNTSEENRKRNRRVDIVVINKQYNGLEPGAKGN